jgi:hypothetical protein
MDKQRRSRLKSVVGKARRVVEDDVKVQLRRLGIDENEIRPVNKLPHLSSTDEELRQKIVEALEKERAGDISYDEAFGRYVRHVGFTYVNRIAALRAMEVRSLIKETMIRRDIYGGRSRREYELAERERISDPYELLKAGLVEAFNEVSAEIRVLFDVGSEYSLVFLGHKALLELIRLLGEEVPEEDWKEDDIIGWIYQYYNEEARAAFRESRRKPKADDIPVINQFYTPRWIVRVLVDNTLGRLWLGMKDRCPKLGTPMQRTKEQLENPSGDKVDDFCSYLVPMSQELLPKERKKVREIKVLDPACGSGHFLVYSFDVLYRMYKEEEPNTPVEEIPRLILERNLFGIDIDLRAVQLAALSLYLKAKSYNLKFKVTKINLVCADARITDGTVRKVFLERFTADPELQKTFAKIFEELEYTYDVGSLFRLREPFERLLEKRREQGVQAVLLPKVSGQTNITARGKLEGQSRLTLQVLEDYPKKENVSETPKATTLEQMLQALRQFEKEAMEKRDMGTLLFATEAEKSVGLLALLSEKYDVVLMNPPYGDMPQCTKRYLREWYPETHHDYYAAFMQQAVELANQGGYIGALVGRTFMFLRWFRWIREVLFGESAPPQLILDLGFGVLDVATARWAAFTARKTTSAEELPKHQGIVFVRMVDQPDELKKRVAYEASMDALSRGNVHPLVYETTLKELSKISGTPFSYWTSSSLRELFEKYPPLDRDVASRPDRPKIADVKVGLQTGDDARFTRLWWEVPVEQIAISRRESHSKKWVPFANDVYLYYFFADEQSVVNWANDGEDIRSFPRSVIRSESLYFKPGLSWSVGLQRSQLRTVALIYRIPFRILQPGSIFGIAAHAVILDMERAWILLALCCSKLVYYLSRLIAPDKMAGTGSMASIPVAFPKGLSDAKMKRLGLLAREAHDLLREWITGNEVSTLFIEPWILQVLSGADATSRPSTGHPLRQQFEWSTWSNALKIREICGNSDTSLRELARLCIKRQRSMQDRISRIQRDIDEEIYRIYNISPENKALIERELSPQETASSRDASYETENVQFGSVSESEHLERLVSYYIKNTIETNEDGIVPLNRLIIEVRKRLANDFREIRVDAIEKGIQEILGKSLEEWIAADYEDFHVNLYRHRPIFWHLTSSNFSTSRSSKGAINIFLHYHKLDRDIIPKILTNYLKPELESAKWKTQRLKRELQEARSQNNKTKEKQLLGELEAAMSILGELEAFDKALETVHNPRPDKTKLPKNPTWLQQRIAEVRDNGYNPVIDYGVRVNIEPLKEAGLLHKAAQRVK